MKRAILIGLVCLMLVGCKTKTFSPGTQLIEADKPIPTAVKVITVNTMPVYRFVDDDYGVICWLVAYESLDEAGAGISCIPLHELQINDN